MDYKFRNDTFQKLMKQKNIDTYILTKFDPHQSEDAGEYYNLPKYFSGFTGSNAKLIITQNELYIFTDGRYYVQCENETAQNRYEMIKESERDSIPFLDFAIKKTKENGVIAFLPDTLSVSIVKDFLSKLKQKSISIIIDDNIVDTIYQNRQLPKTDKIFELDIKYSGVNRKSKINLIRNQLAQRGIKNYIVSSLDDIAYMLNIRGFDVPYNTFFASYLLFEQDKTTLFVDLDKISDVKNILENDNITVRDYDHIFEYIEKINKGQKTLINVDKTCYKIFVKANHLDIIEENIDITANLKAIKNTIEIENIKNSSDRDNASLVRSFKKIKENAKNLTEVCVAKILLEERKKDNKYIVESFHPICAYMGNASMAHYHATEEQFSKLDDEGILLIDSGATYYDGTTDITRTISLGEVSEEIKHDFTLVLKSHIKVANAKFLYGATGSKIDAIAREPMWQVGRNYNHGTGHGIAYVGPVHEGPQSMGFKDNGVMLEENMIMSNEPALYVSGKHGIRTENTVRIIPFMENYGVKFLQFETISYCPIEVDLIKKDMLTMEEIKWLNDYHKKVFDKLSVYLTGDDLEFLKIQTRQI